MLQESNYDDKKAVRNGLQENIIWYKIENKQGTWKQEIVWQKLSKIVTATWGMKWTKA